MNACREERREGVLRSYSVEEMRDLVLVLLQVDAVLFDLHSDVTDCFRKAFKSEFPFGIVGSDVEFKLQYLLGDLIS